MTDIELTEICAKWLGYTVYQGLHKGEEAIFVGKPKGRIANAEFFDPLHDMNDLWKVLEKLSDNYVMEIRGGKFWFYDFNDKTFKNLAEGKLSDLPHAVLELVAEMEVSDGL